MTVSVHDGKDHDGNPDLTADDTIAVTVTVTDVDEAPDLSGPAAVAYDENNSGPVGSYTADDPEGATIIWTLAGTDAGSFTFTDGVLEFAVIPDYEQPADSNRDNTYVVTVQASDGTNIPTQTVTVSVINVDPPNRGGGSGGGGGGGSGLLPPGANQPPAFAEGSRTMRTVAENSPAGTNIGGPVTAEDPEDDPLTYKLAGTDTDVFDFDTETGQLKTKAALDYETKNSYRVTVEVRDSKDPEGEPDERRDDSIAVTVNVANRNDIGHLTLSAPTPRAGQPLQAVLADPDGATNVAWVWERSTDRTTWAPIPDATSAAGSRMVHAQRHGHHHT